MSTNDRWINVSTAVAALTVVLALHFSLWWLFLLIWVAL